MDKVFIARCQLASRDFVIALADSLVLRRTNGEWISVGAGENLDLCFVDSNAGDDGGYSYPISFAKRSKVEGRVME